MTESRKTTSAQKSTETTAKKTTTRKPAAKKTTATRKAPAKKAAPKAAEKQGKQVTIDGQTYAFDALSDNAKAQVNNIRATDNMIAELELELSIARTARSSYSEELERELSAMNTTLQ
ncbi:MAG: hypothetical protein HLX50_01905 [Alteromonadaceae bacterium]|nr:hypothetical protein [Alteromonadaceae bacterium]